MKRSRFMVAKAGGASEPVSLAKLRRCLSIAIGAGGGDRFASDPLAQSVAAHLKSLPLDAPLTSDYVFDCVCTVLVETEMSSAAGHLLCHRQLRSRQRRRIRVVNADGTGACEWNKARLASSLMRRGLGPGAARAMAAEIESKVLSIGYQRISRDLITALAENELNEWGLVGGPPSDACCPFEADAGIADVRDEAAGATDPRDGA